MRTNHFHVTPEKPIQFLPTFFQSAEQLFSSVASPFNPEQQVIYTPVRYGDERTFIGHPDFARATEQYARLFTGIDQFIMRHCHNPEQIRLSFTVFLVRIQDGTFASRLSLLYGEAKNIFETFYVLLHDKNIALEKRIRAVTNLAEELHACADGAINSLIITVRQLQWALAGNLGEVLHIKEQIIEQLIHEFISQRYDDENMEKHYAAVYHNFLRTKYGLPSLESDGYARHLALKIKQNDLYDCLRYVEGVLTPDYLITVMGDACLDILHSVIPADGDGLSEEEMYIRLSALQTVLAPKYGEIPYLCLIREDNGRYYATNHDTQIRICLIQTLHASGIFSPASSKLYHYQMPDTCVNTLQFDPVNRSMVERKQILRGEVVSIYQANSIYWLQVQGNSTPHLLTLANLKPLAKHAFLPPALLEEALNNTSPDELDESLPLWLRNITFFVPYLCFRFTGRETHLAQIIINLFNNDLSHETNRNTQLSSTMQQLGLEALRTTILPQKLLWLLASTIHALIEYQDIRIIDSELLLNNLIRAGMSANTKDAAGHTLLMHAAQQGWQEQTKQLLSLGANPNTVNIEEQTALMLAAGRGHVPVIVGLCMAGANATLTNKYGNALIHAVSMGQVAAVECLLFLRARRPGLAEGTSSIEAGTENDYFDVNTRDAQGKTALHWLFSERFDETFGEITQKILQLLLQYRADPSIPTYDGISVLSYEKVFRSGCFDALLAAGAFPGGSDASVILGNAIRTGQTRALEKLLELQVPVHTHSDHASGKSPIYEALDYRQFDMTIMLLMHGRQTLSHYARASILFLVSDFLLDHRITQHQADKILELTLEPELLANPANPDVTGETFLSEFLRYTDTFLEVTSPANLLKQVEILVQYTELDHLYLEDEDSLLMHLVKNAYVEEEKFIPVIHYLTIHTDLLYLPDKYGQTPFAAACRDGDIHTMKILFNAQPEIINIRDTQGNTPFMLAMQNRQMEAVHWLSLNSAVFPIWNIHHNMASLVSYHE